MPYIDQKGRDKFRELVANMEFAYIDGPGELNYLITHLVHAFLQQDKESYKSYNDVLGALEGAKLELYRQYISVYEDYKIKTNGNVP